MCRPGAVPTGHASRRCRHGPITSRSWLRRCWRSSSRDMARLPSPPQHVLVQSRSRSGRATKRHNSGAGDLPQSDPTRLPSRIGIGARLTCHRDAKWPGRRREFDRRATCPVRWEVSAVCWLGCSERSVLQSRRAVPARSRWNCVPLRIRPETVPDWLPSPWRI